MNPQCRPTLRSLLPTGLATALWKLAKTTHRMRVLRSHSLDPFNSRCGISPLLTFLIGLSTLVWGVVIWRCLLTITRQQQYPHQQILNLNPNPSGKFSSHFKQSPFLTHPLANLDYQLLSNSQLSHSFQLDVSLSLYRIQLIQLIYIINLINLINPIHLSIYLPMYVYVLCMYIYTLLSYIIYVSIYTSSSIYRWLSHENLHLVPGFPSHVSLPANPFFPTAPSATKARSRCMRSASPRLSFWSNCRIWNSDKESTSAANWFSAPMTAPRGSTGIRFGIRFGISETNHHITCTPGHAAGDHCRYLYLPS